MNGVTLDIKGDFTISDKGKLDVSGGGEIKVSGNFIFNSSQSHKGFLSGGTITVGGDVSIINKTKNNFYCTGDNTFTFTSKTIHNLSISADVHFQNIIAEGDIFTLIVNKNKNKFECEYMQYSNQLPRITPYNSDLITIALLDVSGKWNTKNSTTDQIYGRIQNAVMLAKADKENKLKSIKLPETDLVVSSGKLKMVEMFEATAKGIIKYTVSVDFYAKIEGAYFGEAVYEENGETIRFYIGSSLKDIDNAVDSFKKGIDEISKKELSDIFKSWARATIVTTIFKLSEGTIQGKYLKFTGKENVETLLESIDKYFEIK